MGKGPPFFFLLSLYLFLALFPSSEAALDPSSWFLTCGNSTDGVYTCNATDTLSITDGSYAISNCRFIGCGVIIIPSGVNMNFTNVTFENFRKGYSGGVFNTAPNVNLILTDVQFLDLTAVNGAAMFIQGGTVNITNALFSNTVADNLGGAIYGFSGTVISCQNCTFIGGRAGTAGGAFRVEYSQTYLTDVIISNGSSVDGGALSFPGGVAALTNVHLYNNTASDWGGGMVVNDYCQLRLNNVSFLQNQATVAGSAIFLNTLGITWNGGYVQDQVTPQWGGAMYIVGCWGTISNVAFRNLEAASGGVFFIDGGTTITVSDIEASNVTSTVQGGFAYLNGANSMACYRCNITNAQSLGVAGLAILIGSSELDFYNSFISHSTAKQEGGAFSINGASRGSLYDGTILQNVSANVGGGIEARAVFICENSIIQQGSSLQSGGCINVEATGSATLNNCTLNLCQTENAGGGIYNMGNVSLDANSLISNTNAYAGGAVHTAGSGITIIQGQTKITDASANMGGAVFSTGPSTIFIKDHVEIINAFADSGGAIFATTDPLTGSSVTTLQDEIQIVNASSSGCGSVMYSNLGARVTFLGINWAAEAMSVTTKGSLLCIFQSDSSLIQFQGNPANKTLNVSGSVWIENVTVAQDFISRGVLKLFPPAAPVYGSPSRLAWKTKPVIPTRGLRPGEVVPSFSVQVLDRMYNVAPISPQNIIVVAVSSPNQTLSGETVRASLDFSTSLITFSSIAFLNASPGFYNLSVSPVAGTLSTEPGDTFPALEIKIALCNTDEMFSSVGGGRCLPTKSTSWSTRIIFAALGVALIVFVILCSLGIYIYRGLQLVKGSAPLFLVIMNAGVAIMGVSLIAGLDEGDPGCIIRAWFENLGFLTIFVPLLLKTKRIQFIFQNDWAAKKKHAHRLTTFYLLRNLGLVAFVAIALMILWTLLDQPHIEDPTFLSAYIVTGRCARTQGDLVAIFIRIGVLLYAVELAISVRNAPSNYNESKMIGFTTYNWAVFIGIGSSVAAFAVDDPEVAFIISAIAIFVPCLVHTLTMTGYKVVLCYVDPEASNVPSTGYGSRSGRPEPGSQNSALELAPRSPTKEATNSFFDEGSKKGKEPHEGSKKETRDPNADMEGSSGRSENN